MEQSFSQSSLKNIRSKLVVLFVTMLLLVGAYVLYSYSFIEIEVSGSDQNNDVLLLINDKQHSYRSQKIKKIVKRGGHEVLVKQEGGKSHYSLVSTNGYLSTTRIKAELKPERARTFVGNAPGPCMYLERGVLLSYGCGGNLRNLQIHRPATRTLPTYTTPLATPYEGVVEGILRVNDADLVVIKASEENHEQPPHSAYSLNADKSLTYEFEVLGLDETDVYSFYNYREGVLAVSNRTYAGYYFEDFSRVPQQVELISNDVDELSPHAIFVNKDGVSVTFGDPAADLDDESDFKSGETKILTNKEGKTNTYKINGRYHKGFMCGEKELCALGDDWLDIYDTSTGTPKRTFHITGVRGAEIVNSELLLVKNEYIVRLNPTNKTGAIDYSFADYTFCGLQNNTVGYLLCVTSPNQNSSALMIGGSNQNDSIDKKVLPLIESEYITAVSVYKNFVHISPNYGSSPPSISQSNEDKRKQNTVNRNIESLVRNIGIDRARYTVVNPFD